jgi:steroid 5-alpha reductase family enzyme
LGARALWWLVGSLLALHSFPALEVYLGMLPVYVALYRGQEVVLASDAVGFAICVLATVLEYTADTQLSNFQKQSTDRQVRRAACEAEEKGEITGKVRGTVAAACRFQ